VPKLTIRPSSVLLTSGQATTFEAIDDSGKPTAVAWSVSPAVGTLITATPATLATATSTATTAATPPANPRVSSATYVAPLITSAQMIAVIASGDTDSGSATVSLTPDAISVIPTKVDLKPNQSQQFVAVVAGGPTSESQGTSGQPATAASPVLWILSPPVGTLDDNGLYRVPADIPDTTAISVTASSKASGKQATATVSLMSPPWSGRGVQLLGLYLFLVFSLVFLIVLLWPPALPSPDTAKANRIEAEKTLDDRTNDLTQKEIAVAKAQARLTTAKAAATSTAKSATTQTGSAQTDATDAQADLDTANSARSRSGEARDFAAKDLQKKREIEEKVNNPDIDTRLVGRINRELDLLWLVLLSGCLGAFLHMSQSFSDYIGNKTIKESWAWWYYLRPFIGSGLALVFYTAIRGGFMSIATGSNSSASELNPFGIVGVSALVGMFSKAATMKLGEVFDTLFKTDKAKDTKDKLSPVQNTTDAGKSTGTSTGTPTK